MCSVLWGPLGGTARGKPHALAGEGRNTLRKANSNTSTLLKEPKNCELFSKSQRSLEEVVGVGLVTWDLGGRGRGGEATGGWELPSM